MHLVVRMVQVACQRTSHIEIGDLMRSDGDSTAAGERRVDGRSEEKGNPAFADSGRPGVHASVSGVVLNLGDGVTDGIGDLIDDGIGRGLPGGASDQGRMDARLGRWSIGLVDRDLLMGANDGDVACVARSAERIAGAE